MNLSLEERKRKLIEDVCASCSGGGGAEVTGGAGDTGEGIGDPDNLVKALSMLRKAKKKRSKADGT
jgi:hypothetical protein